jgi:hypothetical protein
VLTNLLTIRPFPTCPQHQSFFLMVTISLNTATNGSTKFEEDFVPFSISDSSDDKPGPSNRRRRTDRTNERERETEKNSDREDNTTDRQLSGRRQAISNGDLNNEAPTSDFVKGKSEKIPESEREWDRGKKEAVADDRYDRRNGHGGNRKRKYEEYDDGYSNQKQRREEVGSRKCPWVADLDLNRCTNVAEM